MAITNAQQLGEALIRAGLAAFEGGLDGDSELEPLVAVSVLVPMSVAVVVRDSRAAGARGAMFTEAFCRMCGCTNDNACEPACYWVEPDLCSACTPKVALVLDIPQRAEATNG